MISKVILLAALSFGAIFFFAKRTYQKKLKKDSFFIPGADKYVELAWAVRKCLKGRLKATSLKEALLQVISEIPENQPVDYPLAVAFPLPFRKRNDEQELLQKKKEEEVFKGLEVLFASKPLPTKKKIVPVHFPESACNPPDPQILAANKEQFLKMEKFLAAKYSNEWIAFHQGRVTCHGGYDHCLHYGARHSYLVFPSDPSKARPKVECLAFVEGTVTAQGRPEVLASIQLGDSHSPNFKIADNVGTLLDLGSSYCAVSQAWAGVALWMRVLISCSTLLMWQPSCWKA